MLSIALNVTTSNLEIYGSLTWNTPLISIRYASLFDLTSKANVCLPFYTRRGESSFQYESVVAYFLDIHLWLKNILLADIFI